MGVLAAGCLRPAPREVSTRHGGPCVSGADDVEAAVDMDYRTGGRAEPV